MSEETPTAVVEENEKTQEQEEKKPAPEKPAPVAQERVVEEAKDLVNALMDLGMTPQEISDGVEGRVSMRTIYRWGKGESVPQNQTHFQALVDLAVANGVG